MLLEPSDWSPAQSSNEVLARLSDELAPHTSPETHAAVVELATGIHPNVSGAVAELASLRSRLACDGTDGRRRGHASSHRPGGDHGAVRDRRLDDSLRVLARREPRWPSTCIIGVPAPEDAIRLLNGLAGGFRFCSRFRPILRSGRGATADSRQLAP